MKNKIQFPLMSSLLQAKWWKGENTTLLLHFVAGWTWSNEYLDSSDDFVQTFFD